MKRPRVPFLRSRLSTIFEEEENSDTSHDGDGRIWKSLLGDDRKLRGAGIGHNDGNTKDAINDIRACAVAPFATEQEIWSKWMTESGRIWFYHDGSEPEEFFFADDSVSSWERFSHQGGEAWVQTTTRRWFVVKAR